MRQLVCCKEGFLQDMTRIKSKYGRNESDRVRALGSERTRKAPAILQLHRDLGINRFEFRRTSCCCLPSSLTFLRLPDRPFHNFEALKSMHCTTFLHYIR